MAQSMEDPPIVRARTALKRAQAVSRQLRGGTANGPNSAIAISEALVEIADALDRIEESEKRNADAQRNLALQQAMLDSRLLRVEQNTSFAVLKRIASGAFRSAIKEILPARWGERQKDKTGYATWVAHEQAALPLAEHARVISEKWLHRLRFSVILAVQDQKNARATLESVRAQTYGNWEIVGDADGGGGAELNAAMNLATGDYFAVIAEPLILSPFALFYFAEALQTSAAGLLYCNEDEIDASGKRINPIFKPEWSPDLLTGCMYMGPMVVLRRELFLECGGFSSRRPAAQLFDLVLRATEKTSEIRHLPRVLYHTFRKDQRPPLTDDMARDDIAQVIEEGIERREGHKARCSPGSRSGMFVVRRNGLAREMTIIVCSKSPRLLQNCLRSIRATAAAIVRQIIVVAHEEGSANVRLRSVIEKAGAVIAPFHGSFNFAAMNNFGVRMAEAPHLLFLNDDVTATAADWAEMLSEEVARPEVGAAGAVLRYPSGALEHAGIVTGIGDGAGHVGRGLPNAHNAFAVRLPSSALWPWLEITRNVSAVSGACLAIRRELFAKVGGFDEQFPNNYNDVDLCLRLQSRGYRVECVAAPGLIHTGCQTRPGVVTFEERYRFCARWAEVLARPDPYYSPCLSPTEKVSLNLTADSWGRALLAPSSGSDGAPRPRSRPHSGAGL
jgi:O-antigen biosynthesis protein